jgi:hypothetical protein
MSRQPLWRLGADCHWPWKWLVVLTILSNASSTHAQLRTVALANLPAPGIEDGALVYQFSQSVLSAQAALNSAGRTAFLGRMIGGLGGVTTDSDTGVWADAGGALTLIAREGSQAPGVPAGAVFSELAWDPILNDQGRLVFPAMLREGAGGVTASNNAGIWSQRIGTLGVVAREGSQAPGAPVGAMFSSFPALSYGDGLLAFNNAGHTAFNAGLVVGAGGVMANNDTGIWAETNAAVA